MFCVLSSLSSGFGVWFLSPVSGCCVVSGVPASAIFLVFFLGLSLPILSGLSVNLVKDASPLLLVLNIH